MSQFWVKLRIYDIKIQLPKFERVMKLQPVVVKELKSPKKLFSQASTNFNYNKVKLTKNLSLLSQLQLKMHVLGLFQPLKTLWQCTQHFSFQSADKVERFGSRTEKYPIWRLASNWCSNVETKALHRKKECCSTTFTLYTLKHMQQLCSTYTSVHTVLKRR